jgi:TRAP-type C4-dicarboxylate transport system permease small subunit
MLIIMVVGALDVLLGNTIGYRIPGMIDISQALFCASVFLALPFVVRSGDHITVDLLLFLFPLSLAKAREFFCNAISVAVYALLAYTMWDLFAASWAVNEVSVSLFAFPIYPIKLAAFIGLFLATLASLGRLFITQPRTENPTVSEG